MKFTSKIFALALGVIVFMSGFPSTCRAESYEEKSGAIAKDVLVYRPAGLLLTLGGSILFVVALPISAITGDVKRTAHTLVQTPYDFTFHRPVGTDLRPYTEDYYYYPEGWK